MQGPAETSPSAALLGYSGLCVVLLLSLAIAIVEAVAAIRRKFSASAADKTSAGTGSNHADATRTKKMSLPEFTWMRHLRRNARSAGSSSSDAAANFTKRNANRTSVVSSPPKLSVSNYSDTEGDLDFLNCPLDSLTSELWCPMSQLKQMGAVRFQTPSRRISSPVTQAEDQWTKKSPVSNSRRIIDNNGRHSPRRSYAGITYYAAVPLTPGVARLCGSLSDISESSMISSQLESNVSRDDSFSSTSSSCLPRTLLSLEPSSLTLVNPTALDARLKRIRLIRHRWTPCHLQSTHALASSLLLYPTQKDIFGKFSVVGGDSRLVFIISRIRYFPAQEGFLCVKPHFPWDILQRQSMHTRTRTHARKNRLWNILKLNIANSEFLILI